MATKKSISDYRWEIENCMRLNMKIRNDSGIPDAIERVKASGRTAHGYAVQALREKLIRDGYLIAESQDPEE